MLTRLSPILGDGLVGQGWRRWRVDRDWLLLANLGHAEQLPCSNYRSGYQGRYPRMIIRKFLLDIKSLYCFMLAPIHNYSSLPIISFTTLTQALPLVGRLSRRCPMAMSVRLVRSRPPPIGVMPEQPHPGSPDLNELRELHRPTGALEGSQDAADHGASNGRLITLTKVLAAELAPHNFPVNAIAPTVSHYGRSINGKRSGRIDC